MMTRDEIKSFAIESVEEFEELEFGMCMTWNEIERFAYMVADVGREWVSLTEEEHTELAIQCGCLSIDWVFYGAAVEAKLKEKNGNKSICD